jgi:hypothetical protein
LTDGDGDTAMHEAESGIHLVEHGFADYTYADEIPALELRHNPLI